MDKKTRVIFCISAACIIVVTLISLFLHNINSGDSKEVSSDSDVIVIEEIGNDVPINVAETGNEEIADEPAKDIDEEPVEKPVEEAADISMEDNVLLPQISRRVVCWGDSLTEGTYGNGMTYPISIENTARDDGKDVTVLNYGVYAEESSLICARAGGNPMRLKDSVTIPSDCIPVQIVPLSDMVGYEMLLVFGGDKELSARGHAFIGDNSVNPCILGGENGVEGNISCDPETGYKYFTRLEPGDPVNVNKKEPIQFWAMRDKKEDDILVIWSGNNDFPTPKTVPKTIDYINRIIEYTGTDEYVVINFEKIEDIPDIDEVNEKMAEEYGEHLLDIRRYLREEALNDAGLTATEEDVAYLEEGRIPKSLFARDDTHFTYECYRLIGKQVYKKLCELGYL